ncbi:winged helix-turn-helix transcriptional regulator [Crossiella sp. CA198]|uniref:winged helix-turn-helix transcriptional regulator n=1 Tax=Crossiella sp. CA198 TaxID=3455607 RepID=UPI003F8CFE89
MPEVAEVSTDNCSVARTLAVVGEKWSLLVLREAFFGTARFEEFQRRIGCARNLLTQRLATLVEHGILDRDSYREPGQRARPEYHLTGKGRELYPVLVALMQWGDRHVADPAGPSVLLTHHDCGEPVHAVLTCGAGHDQLTRTDLDLHPGPGAHPA